MGNGRLGCTMVRIGCIIYEQWVGSIMDRVGSIMYGKWVIGFVWVGE